MTAKIDQHIIAIVSIGVEIFSLGTLFALCSLLKRNSASTKGLGTKPKMAKTDLGTKQVLLTLAGHEIHSAVLHHMPKANLLEWGPEQYIHAVGSTGNLKINKHTL